MPYVTLNYQEIVLAIIFVIVLSVAMHIFKISFAFSFQMGSDTEMTLRLGRNWQVTADSPRAAGNPPSSRTLSENNKL